jgi:hypothetical protein
MSVGEQSCRQLVGRSLSGDHVGRKRPRRAAEAKECHGRRQILPYPRDRLIDRFKRRMIDYCPQCLQGRRILQRGANGVARGSCSR